MDVAADACGFLVNLLSLLTDLSAAACSHPTMEGWSLWQENSMQRLWDQVEEGWLTRNAGKLRSVTTYKLRICICGEHCLTAGLLIL